MATVYQLNQLPCKTLSLVPPRQQLKANVLVSYSGFGLRLVEGPKFSIRELNLTRQLFRVQAASDEEWGPEKDEPVGESLGGSPVAVAEEQPDMPYDSAEISKLKKALVDSFYGTDRGLTVSIEMRADIVELITQLEARNPTPVPTEALALLNGKWILAYTSFSGLFPFLSRGTLPLVKVEEISQTIDSENFTVQFAGLRLQLPPMENLKFEVPNAFRLSL